MQMMTRSFNWLLFMAASTAVALYAFYYFVGSPLGTVDETTVGVLTQLRDRPFWFYLHVGGGGTALLLAPWQFIRALRNRAPVVHRTIGRLYVMAILIGGTAGLVMAPNSDAGPIAQLGFASLAVLWLATTAIAFAAAYRRKISTHRRWMIRSVALTLAAVTLRIYVGITGALLVPSFGVDFTTAYVVIGWACWVPNLILAELWLRREQA